MIENKQTPGFVLLSAGRGTRMHPLTDGIPKGLLQAGSKLVLDWMLEAILSRTNGEVVIVTGYGAEKVESHVDKNYPDNVRCARNHRFEEDVNIFSVETGISALTHPERGYVIVETDMLMDADAWDEIFDAINETSHSYWVCKNYYGPDLKGGIVKAGPDGIIDTVRYQPSYDPTYDGWAKLMGVLIVGPQEVAADKRWRQSIIENTLKEYYMESWSRGVDELPARILQLGDGTARTFNTVEDFESARDVFLAIAVRPLQSPEALAVLGVVLVDVDELRHIEGFSQERVEWLAEKITQDGVWNKPVAIDAEHGLVLDGQHRLEAAKLLGLRRIPAVKYRYADVEIHSLRPELEFDWVAVVERSLADAPYPYKTVKHKFPGTPLPTLAVDLEELRT